jgi:hypothetical protein
MSKPDDQDLEITEIMRAGVPELKTREAMKEDDRVSGTSINPTRARSKVVSRASAAEANAKSYTDPMAPIEEVPNRNPSPKPSSVSGVATLKPISSEVTFNK